ncbi:hypothetical protein EC973_003179 [Apophysomyces ossiformis]|uniref:Phosphatase PP2A regulatory subunit A/Splicing factor 3B subunit 1-like HEAT repeat domain-containing protein n=1 Tax=Apophysomyces ossiformis TaxID=679940 RepID=A0A8H7BLZ0_9FUNG|nr:hypothetical protein EC973_003179 [Apophysomyces ossiformis]
MEIDSNPLSPTDYMDEDPIETETTQEQSGLYSIAVLIDELKHEDLQLRVNAIKNLSTIATALGEERTRNELVPFLEELLDDEDDALVALSEELGKFTPYVGGPEYTHCLLTSLENLAAAEEATVRDRAVLSLCELAGTVTDKQIEQYFVPLLKRLSMGEWFTSRTSATGLYPAVYNKVSKEVQTELRNLFTLLVQDDIPVVRRATAKALAAFVTQLEHQEIINTALNLFRTLAQDDQDSVRLLTVEDMIAIAKLLTTEQKKEHLLQLFMALAEDVSWRVKYMLASKYVELSEAFGNPIVREHFIPAFVKLVGDSEGEVRTAAATQIPGFAKFIEPPLIVEHILPCVQVLATDANQHARAALAKEIGGLAPVLGKQATPEHLLPTFLVLLGDEFPDVRLNVISKLEEVNEGGFKRLLHALSKFEIVIGVESMSQSLLPAITELSEDKQWRVRLRIIEYIPLVAKQLGPQIFDERLFGLCMSWLRDSVFSIREAATINLKKLTEVFGAEWAKKTVIPEVLKMVGEESYLHRLTMLFALTTIADAISPEDVKDFVLPTVIDLSRDPIPNIRFNVAKSLESLVPLLNKDEATAVLNGSIVKPALETLSQDSDTDVKFFAVRALEMNA